MLKITRIKTGDDTITLQMEGRIVEQWVDEISSECESICTRWTKIVLDLSGVSFVDDRGVEVLKSITCDRIQLTGCSLFLTELLDID
jgi:anti-anti-sigma regulatory factor